MDKPNCVIFSSYGNDSIALIQLLSEYQIQHQQNVAILYSDTGWAAPDWDSRVSQAEQWASSKGFHTYRTEAVGFPELIRKKSFFPRGMMQFCTVELKILPAQKWLEERDPQKSAICVNGVRRAESIRRRDTPIFTPISDAHGGRSLWSPLAEFSDESRDTLITRAGFTPLPHRSMECSPCIFSSRADLRMVPDSRVTEIRELEEDLGRSMFRPKAYQGAEGIDEIMRWARSDRGQYKPDDTVDCDSGFCGA